MGAMIGQEKDGWVKFHFVCQCSDCDEEGDLSLMTTEHGAVNCPGECGAAYVPWKGPNGKWRLTAVVMPHYGDTEISFDGDDDEE